MLMNTTMLTDDARAPLKTKDSTCKAVGREVVVRKALPLSLPPPAECLLVSDVTLVYAPLLRLTERPVLENEVSCIRAFGASNW